LDLCSSSSSTYLATSAAVLLVAEDASKEGTMQLATLGFRAALDGAFEYGMYLSSSGLLLLPSSMGQDDLSSR
jgi:predicted secreted protein